MIRSGSLCIDRDGLIPSSGIFEIVGYPRCGTSVLLKSMCINNPDRKILYIEPHGSTTKISDNTVITRVSVIEPAINIIFSAIKEDEIDMVIIDSLPRMVSEKAISIIETDGIEHLDNAVNARVWFEALRNLREVAYENNILVVIGNVRKTKLPMTKLKSGYQSKTSRQSQQAMDIFSFGTIYLEVNSETGKKKIVDQWRTKKAEKGLPIPIFDNQIRHDVEKYYMMNANNLVRKVSDQVMFNNGNSTKWKEFCEKVGNDYEIKEWNEYFDHIR